MQIFVYFAEHVISLYWSVRNMCSDVTCPMVYKQSGTVWNILEYIVCGIFSKTGDCMSDTKNQANATKWPLSYIRCKGANSSQYMSLRTLYWYWCPSLGTHFPCPHSVCCIVDSSDGTGTASVRGLGPFWKYRPDPIPSDIIWASVRVEEQIFDGSMKYAVTNRRFPSKTNGRGFKLRVGYPLGKLSGIWGIKIKIRRN